MPYYSILFTQRGEKMAGRNEIEKRIEKERRQISELRNRIEHSEAFILGLQEALKLLPKEKIIANRAVSKLRNGNIKKIYDLLQKVDKPLRVEEILIGIGKENTKGNRLSVSGSLGKYVRDGEIFERVGPNEFALKGVTKELSKDVIELPSDFGKDESEVPF